MNMINERIQIANAMGIYPGVPGASNTAYFKNDKFVKETLPDPFIYAGDDYEVLEFLRKDGLMPIEMCEKKQWHYVVGDYARILLKVLERSSR